MKRFFLIISILLFTSSCATNFHPNIEFTELPENYSAPDVYVENPDLIKELSILEYSELYHIVDNQNTRIHIHLHPIQRFSTCGMGIILTMGTFGIIPCCALIGNRFSFDVIIGNQSTTHQYDLDGKLCTSIWENFRESSIDSEKSYGIIPTTQLD